MVGLMIKKSVFGALIPIALGSIPAQGNQTIEQFEGRNLEEVATKKEMLKFYLVDLGMYSSKNASIYIDQLDDINIDALMHVIENGVGLKAARGAAAVTAY